MRVAPIGLTYYKNPKKAFEFGVKSAVLTHGSPEGYLPAGVLASIIAYIIQGKDLKESIYSSLEILKTYTNNTETMKKITEAIELSDSDINPEIAINKIGEGWSGYEAIAIAIYCALKSSDNIEKALIMAVNHDGDSDSIGAITGNILGAMHSEEGIKPEWLSLINLNNELKTISNDLFIDISEIENPYERYAI